MMRGQVSFESLMLLLVIITTTAYISTLFFQTNDTTTAYAIIRSEFLEQSNAKSEEIILKEITFLNETMPTFYIKTIPQTIINSDFNLQLISQKVENSTRLENIVIQIN